MSTEQSYQVNSGDTDSNSWLISYVDLLLLLVTLFVLLLSYQQIENKAEEEKEKQQQAEEVAETTPAVSDKIFLDQVYLTDLKGRVSMAVDDDRVRLVINDAILFSAGAAILSETGGQVIDELALMLRSKPWHISVEGHTDQQPIATARFPSNWELSSARATQVTRRLISRGVSSQRLSAIGYADTRPLETGEGGSSRAENRRVSLVLSLPPS